MMATEAMQMFNPWGQQSPYGAYGAANSGGLSLSSFAMGLISPNTSGANMGTQLMQAFSQSGSPYSNNLFLNRQLQQPSAGVAYGGFGGTQRNYNSDLYGSYNTWDGSMSSMLGISNQTQGYGYSQGVGSQIAQSYGSYYGVQPAAPKRPSLLDFSTSASTVTNGYNYYQPAAYSNLYQQNNSYYSSPLLNSFNSMNSYYPNAWMGTSAYGLNNNYTGSSYGSYQNYGNNTGYGIGYTGYNPLSSQLLLNNPALASLLMLMGGSHSSVSPAPSSTGSNTNSSNSSSSGSTTGSNTGSTTGSTNSSNTGSTTGSTNSSSSGSTTGSSNSSNTGSTTGSTNSSNTGSTTGSSSNTGTTTGSTSGSTTEAGNNTNTGSTTGANNGSTAGSTTDTGNSSNTGSTTGSTNSSNTGSTTGFSTGSTTEAGNNTNTGTTSQPTPPVVNSHSDLTAGVYTVIKEYLSKMDADHVLSADEAANLSAKIAYFAQTHNAGSYGTYWQQQLTYAGGNAAISAALSDGFLNQLSLTDLENYNQVKADGLVAHQAQLAAQQAAAQKAAEEAAAAQAAAQLAAQQAAAAQAAAEAAAQAAAQQAAAEAAAQAAALAAAQQAAAQKAAEEAAAAQAAAQKAAEEAAAAQAAAQQAAQQQAAHSDLTAGVYTVIKEYLSKMDADHILSTSEAANLSAKIAYFAQTHNAGSYGTYWQQQLTNAGGNAAITAALSDGFLSQLSLTDLENYNQVKADGIAAHQAELIAQAAAQAAAQKAAEEAAALAAAQAAAQKAAEEAAAQAAAQQTTTQTQQQTQTSTQTTTQSNTSTSTPAPQPAPVVDTHSDLSAGVYTVIKEYLSKMDADHILTTAEAGSLSAKIAYFAQTHNAGSYGTYWQQQLTNAGGNAAITAALSDGFLSQLSLTDLENYNQVKADGIAAHQAELIAQAAAQAAAQKAAEEAAALAAAQKAAEEAAAQQAAAQQTTATTEPTTQTQTSTQTTTQSTTESTTQSTTQTPAPSAPVDTHSALSANMYAVIKEYLTKMDADHVLSADEASTLSARIAYFARSNNAGSYGTYWTQQLTYAGGDAAVKSVLDNAFITSLNLTQLDNYNQVLADGITAKQTADALAQKAAEEAAALAAQQAAAQQTTTATQETTTQQPVASTPEQTTGEAPATTTEPTNTTTSTTTTTTTAPVEKPPANVLDFITQAIKYLGNGTSVTRAIIDNYIAYCGYKGRTTGAGTFYTNLLTRLNNDGGSVVVDPWLDQMGFKTSDSVVTLTAVNSYVSSLG